MAYELQNNSGALFRNEKRTAENHPNATGKVMVGGITYYVSAWTKARPNGDKYQSLSFKTVDEAKRAPEKKQDDGTVFNMSDDIPF